MEILSILTDPKIIIIVLLAIAVGFMFIRSWKTGEDLESIKKKQELLQKQMVHGVVLPSERTQARMVDNTSCMSDDTQPENNKRDCDSYNDNDNDNGDDEIEETSDDESENPYAPPTNSGSFEELQDIKNLKNGVDFMISNESSSSENEDSETLEEEELFEDKSSISVFPRKQKLQQGQGPKDEYIKEKITADIERIDNENIKAKDQVFKSIQFEPVQVQTQSPKGSQGDKLPSETPTKVKKSIVVTKKNI